jgi:hypothetical protein
MLKRGRSDQAVAEAVSNVEGERRQLGLTRAARGLRRRFVDWQTRERIARRYRLVTRFAGNCGNGELDGGEEGVNGAASKTMPGRSYAWPKASAQIVGQPEPDCD